MILSKSIKLSVLVLCFAGISSSSFAGTRTCSTKCSDSCDDENVTADQLARESASILAYGALFYAYLAYVSDNTVGRLRNTNNTKFNDMVELGEKGIAAAWFGDKVKDFAKHVHCYVVGKLGSVAAEAQAAVSEEVAAA